jgi:hypothetical protein
MRFAGLPTDADITRERRKNLTLTLFLVRPWVWLGQWRCNRAVANAAENLRRAALKAIAEGEYTAHEVEAKLRQL